MAELVFTCPHCTEISTYEEVYNLDLPATYACYKCDTSLVVAVFTEKEWEAFCQVLGNPSWVKEGRFATSLDRRRNADQLDQLVEEWTKEHSADEVMSSLQEKGIAAGVVQDAADLSQDAQLKARGFFINVDHPVSGKTSCDGSPIKLSETPACFQRAAPLLGQDNEYVFCQLLGMTKSEADQYTAEGILS